MTDNTGQQAAIDVPPAPATGDNASRHFAWAVDAPPAVAQVVRPRAAYPPPELAGIPQRDAEAWGEPFSDDGHELVRVADLVRLHASRSGRQAMRVVAGEVLDALQADGACRFYGLRPGETGLKIHNDEWLMPDTYPGRQYDPVGSSWLPTLECLRWCWVTAATGFAALDAGPHAAVAVRLVDAVRVFGVAALVIEAVPLPGAAPPAPAVWPVWPKPKDHKGCGLLFEAWKRHGGQKGGSQAASSHYGVSARLVEMRTLLHREAAGLARPKKKARNGAESGKALTEAFYGGRKVVNGR